MDFHFSITWNKLQIKLTLVFVFIWRRNQQKPQMESNKFFHPNYKKKNQKNPNKQKTHIYFPLMVLL